MSVVRVEGDKLTLVENVSGTSGRSVVVDPKTHTVWVAYNKGDQAFLQPFAAKQ